MPQFELDASDGQTYTLDAPDEQSAVAFLENKLNGKTEEKPEASLRDMGGAGVQGFFDTATFDFADEIEAGAKTGFGFLGDYDKEKAEINKRQKYYQENTPGSYLSGSAATVFIPGLGWVGNTAKAGKAALTATQAGSKLGRLGRVGKTLAYGAGAGAGYEGIATYGRDEDDYFGNMAMGAGLGAAGGVLGATVAKGIRKYKGGIKSQDAQRTLRGKELKEKSKADMEAALGPNKAIDNEALKKVREAVSPQGTSRVFATGAKSIEKDIDDLLALTKDVPMKPSAANKNVLVGGRKGTPLDSTSQNALLNKIDKKLESIVEPADRKYLTAAKEELEKSFGEVGATLHTAKLSTDLINRSSEVMTRLARATSSQDVRKILDSKGLMKDMPAEVILKLEAAAKDPSMIQNAMVAWSKISPMAIMYNLVRGNTGLTGTYLAASGVGKLARNGLRTKLATREIDDILFERLAGEGKGKIDYNEIEPIKGITGAPLGAGIFGGD